METALNGTPVTERTLALHLEALVATLQQTLATKDDVVQIEIRLSKLDTGDLPTGMVLAVKAISAETKGNTVEDHENRLRSLEGIRWKLIGALGVFVLFLPICATLAVHFWR